MQSTYAEETPRAVDPDAWAILGAIAAITPAQEEPRPYISEPSGSFSGAGSSGNWDDDSSSSSRSCTSSSYSDSGSSSSYSSDSGSSYDSSSSDNTW